MSDEEVQELKIAVARLEERLNGFEKFVSDKLHDLSVWLGIIGSAVLIAAIKVIVQGV